MTTSVLVPALLAGAVAVAVTVAIERWGGRIGGLLGTMPTTIVPAVVGIYGQALTTDDFRAAMHVTPAGMLLDVGFLYLWRVVPRHLPAGWSLRHRLSAMTVISLGAWFVGAAVVVLVLEAIRTSALSLPVFGWVTTALIAVGGVVACWSPVASPAGRRRVGPGTLLMRGVFAATAIGVAIVLTRVAGPFAAGVASVFPAIFLTTMVALWLAQGEAVPAGAVGPMMLGGTSVALYAVLAATAVPRFGLTLGSVVSWFGAVALATVPAWLWLRSRD